MTVHVVTLNAGSSSIKFAVYGVEAGGPRLVAKGQVEGVGTAPRLAARAADGALLAEEHFEAEGHAGALSRVLALIEARLPGARVGAVGHRIVHGGVDFVAPVILDARALDRLAALEPFAPLHQPHNLAAVRGAIMAFPGAVQVGCFDTAFHRAHPWEADAFALPRRFYDEGVRRYGFHGLSYDYVSGRLREIDPALAAGRVAIAHLGNGASMCGVVGGRSVTSSMGFTALDGLPMGTRSGQIDPGVLLYLMDQRGMTAAAIADLLYRESGLKGLSGVSHDMRALEASPAPEAAQAIRYFVHRIRRELGATAAAMGGLDALVFCGGIGENSARIRAAVCEGFGWLGLALDAVRNDEGGEGSIASAASAVAVHVVRTDEEIVIARACLSHL